jgi:tetratricopeptide (TPR) repeat protein
MEHEFEMALEQYKKSLEISPKLKDSLISVGMTYLKMGRTDQTIDHLERVRSTIPEDGKLCYYLGSAYDKKGMHHEAATYYAIYLGLLPHDANHEKVALRLKQIEAAP